MKKLKSSSIMKELDLETAIHGYSQFFDRLVDLIPARFYLPTDNTEKPWFQGLSKHKQASRKQKSQENLRKARRNRLDPEKSGSTTSNLLKESLEKDKLVIQGSDGLAAEAVKPVFGKDGSDRSVTYEELRGRLHKRIEELRSGRGGSDNQQQKKRRREEHGKCEKRDDPESCGNQQKKRRSDGESERRDDLQKKGAKLEEESASAAVKELAFGNVKLDAEDMKKKRKKKKVSKAEELERAERLAEAKKDVEMAKKHSWKAASERAAGAKVHDDPKLLRQSMRRERKRQEKSAGKWRERTEGVERRREEKQRARAENITGRAREKKLQKIARREKKQMRPGFEGRKEGYINEGQS